MLTHEEAAARVAKGAAHLDTVRPGWERLIDVGTLTLHDPCGCIVGQLGTTNSFIENLIELEITPFEAESVRCGVDLPTPAGTRENFALLQDAWVELLAARRIPDPQPADPVGALVEV